MSIKAFDDLACPLCAGAIGPAVGQPFFRLDVPGPKLPSRGQGKSLSSITQPPGAQNHG